MTTPRIAVCQAPYIRDVRAALDRTVEHLRQSASRGVDLVVLPEWSIGLNPVEVLPSRYTDQIGQACRELNVVAILGSIRVLDAESGKKQQRALIFERDGRLIGTHAKMSFHPTERPWFEPGTGVTATATSWGQAVVLSGLDALDEDLWNTAAHVGPDLVVMAVSPRTVAERALMQDLAVARSAKLQATVVLAPLIGRFSGASYCGGALIAHDGRILAMADDQPTVLVAGDPQSPLIQLGVTDASCYLPLAPVLPRTPMESKRTVAPEAERRVLVDWGALQSSDPLTDGLNLLKVAQDNPRWTALAPARPLYDAELKQLLERGAQGAFAYPGLEGLYPWNEPVRRLGQALAERRLPLVVHTGPGSAPLRFDRPSEWDEFSFEFPTVPLILLHMGARSPYIEEALVMAERHPQVWLETSRAPLGAIREAIATLGPARLIFGSGDVAAQFAPEWAKIESLEPELSKPAFAQITNHNARQLFFPHLSSAGRHLAPVPYTKRLS